MESNLTTALQLLVIGMGAVFFILFIVVSGGKFLITIVNKVSPAEEGLPFTKIKSTGDGSQNAEIIRAVVDVLTMGKGVVDKIEKKSS